MVGHWKEEDAESSAFRGLSMNILDLLSRSSIRQSFALFLLLLTISLSNCDEVIS